MSTNIWVGEGNLTEDPTLRFTQSGKAVASGSVAIGKRVRDEKGNWSDGDTTYVDWTAWDTLAENVAESLFKGMRVVVVGRLEQERWEAKDGSKRSKLKVMAESVTPSLRWASADVTRNEGGSGGGGGGSATAASGPPPYDPNEEPF